MAIHYHDSPDRRYAVELEQVEMRMSHWVSSPRVRDMVTGRLILDLTQTLWHADAVQWDGAGDQVTLTLRHYPGRRPGITLTLNLPARCCTIQSAAETVSLHLADARQWLEAYANDTQNF